MCYIGLLQVLFAGERIGQGIGRTRREAQRQAAEESLVYLAGNIQHWLCDVEMKSCFNIRL